MKLYAGRIASAGMTLSGHLVVMYRVSSRSFPNRTILKQGDRYAVLPKAGSESDLGLSPFIAYNCLRLNSRHAVVGNGTHTDPVFERLAEGMSLRDALVTVLHEMDFEHDTLRTPRIVAVSDRVSRTVGLGIVRDDGLEVKVSELAAGQFVYVSTYEHASASRGFGGHDLEVANSSAASSYIFDQGLFAKLTHPIASVAAFETPDGYESAEFPSQ